jgi:hypothetical protein
LWARGDAWHAAAVPVDPTARALRAVHVLAADLAAERRESATLRRLVAELEAEVERLKRDAATARALTARHPPGSCPAAPVAERS